jgi:Flp pilus assembly protein TadD
MSHVFISYSTHDSAYANKLAEKLRAEGFDVWIDNSRLRSSEDWWHSIVLAIDACAAFVVLLTSHSDQSKWVQREITLADQRNKPTFPLWLAGDIDTPNWALFVRTQYADVRDGHLPDPAFFAKLADHVPRRRGEKGTNVVRSAPPRIPAYDPVLQTAIDTPPPRETKPTRRSRGWLVFIVALVIVVGVGAAILVPPPAPSPLSPQQYFAQGIEAADREDYVAAIGNFTQALEAGYDPAAVALTMRGNMRRMSGDPTGAIGDYEAAVEADPDFADAYMGLGATYADTGQKERAIDTYNRAHELSQGTALAGAVLVEMGRIFREDGNIPAAIEHFDRALNETSDSNVLIGAHRELGRILTEMGDFPAAIFHLQSLTELYPGEIVNYLQLGEAYEQIGDLPAAVENYRRFAELAEQGGQPVDEDLIRHIGDLEREITP